MILLKIPNNSTIKLKNRQNILYKSPQPSIGVFQRRGLRGLVLSYPLCLSDYHLLATLDIDASGQVLSIIFNLYTLKVIDGGGFIFSLKNRILNVK